MSGVPAKFASALFVGIVAGAAWTALPQHAAQAADCLTEPKNETPQGQHWYFRIERGTGRHCWYMRGEDEKSARVDTPDPAPAEKPAPKRTEAATTRSIADAHAEIGPRARVPGRRAAAAHHPYGPTLHRQRRPERRDIPNARRSPQLPLAPDVGLRHTGKSAAGKPTAGKSAAWQTSHPRRHWWWPTDAHGRRRDAQTADVSADAASQTVPPPMLAAHRWNATPARSRNFFSSRSGRSRWPD